MTIKGADKTGVFNPRMTKDDFLLISRFVTDNYGIKLPEQKKIMLEGRLRKRLVHLNMKTYKEYCQYLFSGDVNSGELQEMIDLVSTNKTDFFREPDHYAFLKDFVLPDFQQQEVGTIHSPIKIWSAGCSTGEEPYTLSIVLSEFAALNYPMEFSVLASDISMRVLKIAQLAIYPETKIVPISLHLRRKYLLRGKGEESQKVRFVPEIRKKISFRQINLMNENEYPKNNTFHVIFCRNVMIYFDRETQERLIERFYNCLVAGGYLFLGHSEALPSMNVPLETVSPMVYRRPTDV